MMTSRRKILVFLFVFSAATSVLPLPLDDSTVIDEDATIQPNPNYTEPTVEVEAEGVGGDIVETKEKDDVKENDSASEKRVEEQLERDTEEKVDEKDEHSERDMNEVDSEEISDDDEGVESEDEYQSADEYDEEEDEKEVSKEAVKQVLAQALSKSRKVPRRTLAFVKKNRVKLTIAVFLFAFRNEIKHVLLLLFTKPKTIDPETGKVLSRTLNISPTAVLKLLLFLDFLRKMKSGDVSEVGSRESFFRKLMQAGNTAFVPPIEQHWTFEKVNERYDKDKMAYQKAVSSGLTVATPKKESLRSFATLLLNATQGNDADDLVIILDWTKLTESIDQMSSLSDQVSFILSQHRAKNNILSAVPLNATDNVTFQETTEVIVMLESPGGAATEYGLAAQTMMRLSHEPGIVVTVCVDKVAASGGYMIACASSPGRLYAAPFAILGSIGVVGSSINIHNVLQGWGIKPLVFRGGKHKAPVGLIGEVTTDGIKQVQNMVDATHVAFKRHVVAARPVLADNIDQLATGQVWLAYEALKVKLIDRIITSDEYIGERILEGARVLRLIKYHKPRFMFTTHGPRLNPINVIQGRLKAVMIDFAQALQRAYVGQDMPMVATDDRLTTARTSLGSSLQSTRGKVP